MFVELCQSSHPTPSGVVCAIYKSTYHPSGVRGLDCPPLQTFNHYVVDRQIIAGFAPRAQILAVL
jgi:hypothetical protein